MRMRRALGIGLLATAVLVAGCGKTNREDVERTESASGTPPIVYTEWPFDAVEAARRQQETAERLGVPKELTLDCGEGVQLTLVLIPAGEFMMGSRDSAEEVARNGNWSETDMFKDEHPRHRVRITRPFYMATTEVTEEQYDAVTGIANRYPRGATHPRTEVIWDGAAFFCSRLSERTGRTVSLPTEAQWEYACRAGTTTRFYTGETITTEQANKLNSQIFENYKKNERWLYEVIRNRAKIDLVLVDPFWARLDVDTYYPFTVPVLNISSLVRGFHRSEFTISTGADTWDA